MKSMRTELTPLRRKRCESLITGCAHNVKFAAGEIAFIARNKPAKFIAMLTDETVEELAFKVMSNRVFTNRLNAKNRALRAQRVSGCAALGL